MTEHTRTQLDALLAAHPTEETLFIAADGTQGGYTDYLAYDPDAGMARHIVVREVAVTAAAEVVSAEIPTSAVPSTAHTRAVSRAKVAIDSMGTTGDNYESLYDLLTDLMHWSLEVDDADFEVALIAARGHVSEEFVED